LGSDVFPPLVDIWQTLRTDPTLLKKWYGKHWKSLESGEKVAQYESIKASYNANPNGADLLFLCRSCYGGVVRFRKSDGFMSTPCGPHRPIPPASFARRVDEWHTRTAGTEFRLLDYSAAMELADRGDLVYCDPPYQPVEKVQIGVLLAE